MINLKKMFFFTVVFPIILFLCLFSMIYRALVNFVLTLKYGKKFGGILNGQDALWLSKNSSSGVINILFMVEFDPKFGDFYKAVKKFCYKKIFLNPTQYFKLTSIFKHEFGYAFFFKSECTVDDCIKELKDEIKNEDDLQKVLCKYSNTLLPKNHRGCWEVLVCKQSIAWRNHHKKCYPVILRFHHAMTDALHFINAFAKMLNYNKSIVPELSSKISLKTEHKNGNNLPENKQYKIPILKKIVINCYATLLVPFVMFDLMMLCDDNALHGKTLSEQKILTWKIMDKKVTDKIRRIKNKISKCKFGTVLLTAVAASIEEYFKRNSLNVPESITVGMSMLPMNVINLILNGPEELVLTNDVSGVCLSIPIQSKTNSFNDRLKCLNKHYNKSTGVASVQAHSFCLNLIPKYWPTRLINFNQNVMNITMVISNLLNFPCCTISDDIAVVDALGWVPHFRKLGLGLAVFTYGGSRLEFGLSVDTALINSLDEANNILNGITKNIDKMAEELHIAD